MKASSKNLDQIILEALRSDSEYLSGEALAKKLKISRQALWKHIGNLSDRGYDIAAVPHLGYKLVSAPDKFYPEEVKNNLGNKLIASQVYYYDSIDSTQSLAWKLGSEGAPEGSIVFSETQKKGKGRLSRAWTSPKGGIYFSLLLKPKFLSLAEVPQISLLIALAVIKGIKQAVGIECGVKWPNDIILNNKKLGGILCEINAETDRVHFVVVGVGINVNSKDLPPEATSLLLSFKKKFRRLDIAQAMLRQIEAVYLKAQQKNFSSLLSQWSKFCVLWGRRVRVKVSGKVIEGEAVNIDEKGYLILRADSGLRHKISAGDIVKVNPVKE